MGMGAWSFIVTPLVAAAPNADVAPQHIEMVAQQPAGDSDLFGSLASLDDSAMSAASGGSDTAIDIANLGVNVAENNGQISGVTTTNSTNGEIANNMITDNGGITTVFNNTGNGVVMQSIVNLNIFLQGGGIQP